MAYPPHPTIHSGKGDSLATIVPHIAIGHVSDFKDIHSGIHLCLPWALSIKRN